MEADNVTEDYKFESSYIIKTGFKVRSYIPYYNNEDKKKVIQEEITKSCLRIYEKIKEH